MTVVDWLPVLTLGALLGATGQAARTIPGIKKLSDEAAAIGTSTAALIVPSQLVTSLLIGAVAGILGIVSLQMTSGMELSTKDVLMIVSIGYAGTDFIEAFVRKEVPSAATPSPSPSAAPPAAPNPALPTPSLLSVGPRIPAPDGAAKSQAVG